jgi:hypothetical protein
MKKLEVPEEGVLKAFEHGNFEVKRTLRMGIC